MPDQPALRYDKLFPSALSKHVSADIDDVVQSLFDTVYDAIIRMQPGDYHMDRIGTAIFYRVPFLLGLGRDLSSLNAVEFGCGKGAKSLAWAGLFRRYEGFDLNVDDIDFARRAAAAAGVANVRFAVANAADVVRDPVRFGIDEPIGCIVLYAVLEHLTLPERADILRAARELLQGGGLLVVAEAPNRLIPHDGHSTFLHFFQTLPPELAIAYLHRSARPEAQQVLSSPDPVEALSRFGTSVSYHEFELYLADAERQMPPIIASGWNHWLVSDEPIRRDELALSEYFRLHGGIAPSAFARYWIEAVFDFGAAASTSPVVQLRLPEAGGPVAREPRPQCWLLDLFQMASPGSLRFDLAGAKPVLLQIDLSQSRGEMEVLDGNGRSLLQLDMDHLRASRFPRWHSRIAVDLTGFSETDTLSFRPAGLNSNLAVDGLLVSDELAR